MKRWKPLAIAAKCISEQGGIVRIYGPEQDIIEHGSHFSGLPNVEIGTLASSEILSKMKESDILIHVESFEGLNPPI